MATIRVTCPNCAKTLRFGSRPAAGKKVKCPSCSEAFLPELDDEEEDTGIQVKSKAKATVLARGGDDDDDDDEPSGPPKKRRRGDDDEDLPPIKKGKQKQKSRSMLLIAGLVVVGGGGVLASCVLCGLGAFVWPGFLLSKKPDFAAFVPPDANIVMGGNPKKLHERFAKLEQLILQHERNKPGAKKTNEMEDITFKSEYMLAFGYTKNNGKFVTVFQSTAEDIAKVKNNPNLGQAQTIGGHPNVHRPIVRGEGTPAYVAFPGNNVVVVSDESEAELVGALTRGKQPAQPNATLQLSRSIDSAPLWVAVTPDAKSLQEMKQELDRGGGGGMMQMPQPVRDMSPALLGIKNVTMTFNIAGKDDIKLQANVLCKDAGDAVKIKAGSESLIGAVRGVLQLGAAFQAPGQPDIKSVLEAMNGVKFSAKDATATADMVLTAKVLEDLVRLGLENPGPGPQPPPNVNPFPPIEIPVNPPKEIPPKEIPPKEILPKEIPPKEIPPVNPGQSSFTVLNLLPNRFSERTFNFQQGRRVIITMNSTVSNKGTDVDLFVLRGNEEIAKDRSIGPNGRVDFVVPVTGAYRVRVANLGPGIARSARVVITEQ